MLRSRRFVGFKFRRQVPFAGHTADFACHAARLIIELDGSQHYLSPHDLQRDEALEHSGYRVLRFWNAELDTNRDGVMEAIWQALQERIS